MGALVSAGALYGYVKARSVHSLVAGVAIGGAFLGSASLIQSNRSLEGHGIAAAASVTLAAAMGARFATSKKVMPAGALAALGLVSSVYQIAKFKQWYGTQSDHLCSTVKELTLLPLLRRRYDAEM